ncbi:reticulon-1a isoform X2 [Erpetoichthys calabaricus]|uniref:reticulon-1a isoform X2 n=1 Tax=Erpetoichthys calabaricus TaxID=27687 RepID=UPI00223433F3|nr:reticulon-1a isoform X2 [Erpetoichthys calabaricus]
MSTHPNVESGSDSNWFGEDFEQIDRFGNSLTTMEEKAAVAVSADVTQRGWREEQPAEPANSRPPPPVTMETASTGHAQYSDVGDPQKFEKTAEDNGTFYTSLLSDLNPGIHQDPLSSSGDQNWDVPSDFKNSDMKTSERSRDRIPSFESQSMFSSDSGIEMTPGESIDSKSILECEKMEGYHYIDISCSRNTGQNDKGVSKGNLEDKIKQMNPTPQMLSDLGDYSEKRPTETPKKLGAALEKHHCPYVEDLSDEDTSDYQIMGNPNKVSPVKITLTQIDAPLDNRVTVSEKESILSLGLEGVPTVTLSEPEDDSLGSSTPPLTAIDLLYWRDLKQTGILFGSVLLLLFSLTQFSVVSVIAYLALAALSATISFRIYKSVLQAVQKTDEGHPFKAYLDVEISLSQEQIQKYADNAQLYLNSTMKELRRLFLVQDLVDSLKFAVLMWLLTYVGALFNGLTLLIMAVISMFTMPVVYEKYQVQIDQYLGLVRTHVNSVVAKIQAKIPGAKRKAE